MCPQGCVRLARRIALPTISSGWRCRIPPPKFHFASLSMPPVQIFRLVRLSVGLTACGGLLFRVSVSSGWLCVLGVRLGEGCVGASVSQRRPVGVVARVRPDACGRKCRGADLVFGSSWSTSDHVCRKVSRVTAAAGVGGVAAPVFTLQKFSRAISVRRIRVAWRIQRGEREVAAPTKRARGRGSRLRWFCRTCRTRIRLAGFGSLWSRFREIVARCRHGTVLLRRACGW